MRAWDRLFFVNERRLRNFVKAGAIDADSPAIRLVGYPKVDAWSTAPGRARTVLESLGLDPARPTRALRADLVARVVAERDGRGADRAAAARRGVNLIVKLHDRSRDLRDALFGRRRLGRRRSQPLLRRRPRRASRRATTSAPYLVAADLMITDHSSAGFEFLLRDRPIVRIHRPELIRDGEHPSRLRRAARLGLGIGDHGRRDGRAPSSAAWPRPTRSRETRRAVAADLFYRPGGATARAVAAALRGDRARSRAGRSSRRRRRAGRKRHHAGVQRRAVHRRRDPLRARADLHRLRADRRRRRVDGRHRGGRQGAGARRTRASAGAAGQSRPRRRAQLGAARRARRVLRAPRQRRPVGAGVPRRAARHPATRAPTSTS